MKTKDKLTAPMSGAFSKLAGAFLIAGAAMSVATGSIWPLVLFVVVIFFCLTAAHHIESKYPGRVPKKRK